MPHKPGELVLCHFPGGRSVEDSGRRATRRGGAVRFRPAWISGI